jgi:hypothetical protein
MSRDKNIILLVKRRKGPAWRKPEFWLHDIFAGNFCRYGKARKGGTVSAMKNIPALTASRLRQRHLMSDMNIEILFPDSII